MNLVVQGDRSVLEVIPWQIPVADHPLIPSDRVQPVQLGLGGHRLLDQRVVLLAEVHAAVGDAGHAQRAAHDLGQHTCQLGQRAFRPAGLVGRLHAVHEGGRAGPHRSKL